MEHQVEFVVNGRTVAATGADIQATLLTFLRDRLHLTGTKNGCAQGHCGACTVIVNGQAQRACLVRVSKLAGAQVQTIEGLAAGGRLHPVQEAFVREGAIQCGFCTPGMVMASKALLDRTPQPSDEQIREALKNNLCRCTGYAAILRAVRLAVRLVADPAAAPRPSRAEGDVIGQSVRRKDAEAKVAGALHYADDLYAEGMLYARALHPTLPHAEVVVVDTAEAEKMPGVVAVFTAKDVPGKNRFGMIRDDQPVLADDRVRYVGDAVACVFAETAAEAEAAMGAIRAEYRELEAVSTPQRALEEDAPRLHERGNILAQFHVRKGDVEAAFARADVIVENDYFTPFIEHAYLEPEACLANPDGHGGVEVRAATQGPYVDRKQIAAALGLEPERVRVIFTPMGGGFGGKEDVTAQILAALGALKLNRPVKMVLSRPESIRVSSKRHAEYLHYKTAASKDGRLLAVEAKIIGDTGAYTSAGIPVLMRSAAFACGPYQVANVKVDSYGVFTNNPPAGAMRGYGSPQVAFAAEGQMDALAARLGMDPFELRLKNVLDVGAVTATGQRLTESVGVRQCLEAVREQLGKEKLPTPQPGSRLGVGVAVAYKNVGLGPHVDDRAGALAELSGDGQVVLRTGCIDMGQGQDTVMAQIAAHTLGVPYERVVVISGDTATCPDSYMTTASRATLFQGRAVQMAAEQLRQQILDYACSQYDLRPDTVRLESGAVVSNGGARLELAEIGAQAARQQYALRGEGVYQGAECYQNFSVDEALLASDPDKYRLHIAYCFAAQACILEVNEATGGVRVHKMILAQDVGKALHPQNIRGQMEGGIVMGLGYGLSEEFVVQEGRVVTDTLRKLHLPGVGDAPEMVTLIVEDPHSEGPLGAKGMAELSVAASAPAIASAIRDAVGVPMRRIPITAERLREQLLMRGG